jgi:sulfite exporter TauE/SafE
MIELPLVLISGLLGSSHCIGMCGGFAMLIGMGQPSVRRNVIAQLAYSGGRIFTYSVLGAIAGAAGMRLSQHTTGIVQWPAALCVAAGLFLVVEGLSAAGFELRRWRKPAGRQGGCLAVPMLATLLKSPGLHHVFSAGLLTGFLPCGLVYAFLALAASMGNVVYGLLLMAVFGVGTMPLMLLTGTTASLLSVVKRRKLMHLAAWCVVLTGALTVARGLGFLDLFPSVADMSGPRCLFCGPEQPAS